MTRTPVHVDPRSQQALPQVDWVVACVNGHIEAHRLQGIERLFPPRSAWTYWAPKHCRRCQARVIARCEKCSKKIAATSIEGAWRLDKYCARCGTSHPWLGDSSDRADQGADRRDEAVKRAKRFGRNVGTYALPHLVDLAKVIIRGKYGLPPS
jgi:Uncharacterized protein conserved in bacteria (DUF2321)